MRLPSCARWLALAGGLVASSHSGAMIKIALHDSHHAADHRDNVLHVWNEVFGAVDDATDQVMGKILHGGTGSSPLG